MEKLELNTVSKSKVCVLFTEPVEETSPAHNFLGAGPVDDSTQGFDDAAINSLAQFFANSLLASVKGSLRGFDFLAHPTTKNMLQAMRDEPWNTYHRLYFADWLMDNDHIAAGKRQQHYIKLIEQSNSNHRHVLTPTMAKMAGHFAWFRIDNPTTNSHTVYHMNNDGSISQYHRNHLTAPVRTPISAERRKRRRECKQRQAGFAVSAQRTTEYDLDHDLDAQLYDQLDAIDNARGRYEYDRRPFRRDMS